MGWWDRKSGDRADRGGQAGHGGHMDSGRPEPVPPQNAVVPFQEPGKPSRRAFLERQIADHIKQNPDAVIRLIRRWLREDEE